jgi:hypothetical protein
MRFLMMMIPRGYQPDTPASERPAEDFVPQAEELAPMGKFNDDLTAAGMLIEVDGLKPLANGARVAFAKGKATVTDGPFIESKEVIGGFWILQANSKQEVVEWAQRCPALDGDVLEIRQIFEMADFAPHVQQATDDPAVGEQAKKQK